MPSVSPLPRLSSPGSRSGPSPVRPRRASPPLLGGGVVVLVLSALAFASLYSGAAKRTPVLVVARAVAPGSTLSDADLRDIEISAGPGLEAVSAAKRATVVGRRAAVALAPGALLSPTQLASGPRLAPGEALVPLALPPGRFPPELAAGDTVAVVETARGALASATPPEYLALAERSASASLVPPPGPTGLVRARVLSVRLAESPGGGALVSLVVGDDLAPGILSAGAAGQVGLLLLGTEP